MKKLTLYLFIVLMFASFVSSADTFTVNYIPVKTSISHDETAYFKVIITNADTVQGEYLIKFPNSDWIGMTEPLDDYRFFLDSGKSKTLNISLMPKSHVPLGPHSVPLVISDAKTGSYSTVNLPLQLLSDTKKEYLPSVRFDPEMKYDNDPRQPISIKLNIDNLNYRDIKELKINVKSAFFSEERVITIPPQEYKEETFVFDIDPYHEPATDTVRITLSTYAENKTYKWEKTVEYRITSYNEVLKTVNINESFMRHVVFIDVYNDGNTGTIYTVSHATSFWKYLFTQEVPESSYMKTEQDRFLVWEVHLEPKESATIAIYTDYRVLALLAFILLIGIFGYYAFRPSLVVKKEVSNIGTSEGGISDIKIILYIKNRSRNIVGDLAILEKIPHIADIGNDFQVGTIKPSKVLLNPKKGTLVKWELQSLESGEERIITYRIKSKLSILGGITLPPTTVRYNKAGRQFKVRSNRLILEI